MEGRFNDRYTTFGYIAEPLQASLSLPEKAEGVSARQCDLIWNPQEQHAWDRGVSGDSHVRPVAASLSRHYIFIFHKQ